jgi:endo-1,3(4)-beta-glucanase
VTDTKNATYIIYSLTPITLTASSTAGSSGTIAASEAFTGVLRVVKLEDPIHKTILDEHYQIYPVSVGQTYGLSNTIGTVSFRWNTVGNGDNLLMLTWPHHRLAMQNGNFPDMKTLSYMTTKVDISHYLSPSSRC